MQATLTTLSTPHSMRVQIKTFLDHLEKKGYSYLYDLPCTKLVSRLTINLRKAGIFILSRPYDSERRAILGPYCVSSDYKRYPQQRPFCVASIPESYQLVRINDYTFKIKRQES